MLTGKVPPATWMLVELATIWICQMLKQNAVKAVRKQPLLVRGATDLKRSIRRQTHLLMMMMVNCFIYEEISVMYLAF